MVSGQAVAQDTRAYSYGAYEDIGEKVASARVKQAEADFSESASYPVNDDRQSLVIHGHMGPFKKAYAYTRRLDRGHAVWIVANVEGEWAAWSPWGAEGSALHDMFFIDVQGDGLAELIVIVKEEHGSARGINTSYTAHAFEWSIKKGQFEPRPAWIDNDAAPANHDPHSFGFMKAADVVAHVESRVLGAGKKKASKPSDAPVLKPETVRVKMKRRRAMEKCYARGLKIEPELKGSVTLRLNVDEDGRVSDAEITDSTIKLDVVRQCMLKTAKSWDYEQLQGKSTTIDRTYTFTSDEN